jgi:peptide/nickel transport system substrate-binding protein
MQRTRTLLAAALCTALFATAADAKTLRWSTQGDPQTMDPYSQNEQLTNNVNGQIYETLVNRDRQLNIVPVLAMSWQQVSPMVWRFKLRPNVKFHDGTPLTADDVVFSIERAKHPNSQLRQYANAAGTPVKIDDLTVELRQEKPNPILLEHLTTVQMMSKVWSMKNKAEKPLDFKNKEETFASRNANGTGPYMLVSREPDIKTVLKRNPNWWNKHEGNVDEVIYRPIASDGTRVAALLSGEVDLIQDPPPQDLTRLRGNPQVKVIDGMENRIVFFGFDQFRDELQYSSVKGKNPFKDKRVRQAFYQAIDIEAIKAKTMRGMAFPTGANTPSDKPSTPDIEKRVPYDRAAAKKLLVDAGYPNGFEVTLDCPNNRYINDEEICVAVAAMLAQIDVKIRVNAMPKATYFPKLEKNDTSMYMLGWGGAITDAQTTLDPVLHSKDGKGKGDYNYGRYVNAKVDELTDQAAVETNPEKRKAIVTEALLTHKNEFLNLPLHRQVIPWASRSSVKVVHRADNWVELAWVSVE